jgi:valyl-tRNA synthetase
LARNFCNKLWNVSRLILINLDGYTHRKLGDAQIAFEDHWILSRLASVTRDVTTALETYRYADAARTLYDFAWDEFCSFYAEMAKPRFENKQTRGTAQIMIAHVLDNLLRLLHPMTPFLTEEVWSLLGRIAPVRGLDESKPASEHIVIAQWPEPDWRRRNETLERQFFVFQSVLGAIREIRSRQGIAPRKAIEFSVRCDEASAKLLQPMQPFFSSMAWARCTACGPAAEPPATHAQVRLHEIDVYVDLRGLIDVQAERVRLEKQIEKLEKSIADKQTKLGNETFLRKAPPDVVRREQDSLAELRNQLTAARETLSKLSDG